MQADKLRELLTEAVGFAPYDLRDSARLALYELLAIAEGAEADRADARRYRYLRDKAPAGAGEMASVRDSHSAREIDTAIDSAMAEVSHE